MKKRNLIQDSKNILLKSDRRRRKEIEGSCYHGMRQYM